MSDESPQTQSSPQQHIRVASSSHQAVEEWDWPEDASPLSTLKRRILDLLSLQPNGDAIRWPWWALRQALGGYVRSQQVRAAVEELIAEGRLLEVWDTSRGRRQPRHTLVRREFWARHSWRRISRIRGRGDTLRELGYAPAPHMRIVGEDPPGASTRLDPGADSPQSPGG